MSDTKKNLHINRRDFMKTSAVAGSAMLASSAGTANAADDGLIHRNEQPDKMSYTKLGRTNFMCSKLVFGCGAALAGGRAVRLLERAFDNGVNHYDIGYDDYYKGSEKAIKEFANRHRDEIWITSKAPARGGIGVGTDLKYTVAMAKADATFWTKEIDKSLSHMGIDYVDAYYLMMVGNPEAIRSEELRNAFLKAKEAGKVGHWGISTHLRAHECLEVAIETDWYDLAMVAITPAGWYDTVTSKTVSDRGSMKDLRPFLDKARKAGIGLVGMKAARHIALNPYEGMAAGVLGATGADPSMYDAHYSEKLMKSGLNPFQRTYAYLVENGMDVVNSDMQNFKHFEENIIAARDAHTYFA
ncbi:MAG: aldo/keto reductase [Candidatus Hydrogenedentota bacterium]